MKKTREVFAALDEDKSGLLSSSEMKQFLQGFFLDMGVEDEDDLDAFHMRLMAQIDRDGDGCIDLEGDDDNYYYHFFTSSINIFYHSSYCSDLEIDFS